MSDQDVIVDYTIEEFRAAFPGAIEHWIANENSELVEAGHPDHDEDNDEYFFTVNGFPTVTVGGDFLHWVDGDWITKDDLMKSGRVDKDPNNLFRID